MLEHTELHLVEAAIDGDIDSFGRLCRQYYPAMVAVGYSVLGDHQLAEDAAQESFARALVKLTSLKNKEKFAAWLAGICRNVAKDILIANNRQNNQRAPLQVSDQANIDDNGRLIHLAIEQLPDSVKELVILRYYDGLTYEQISSVLGISKASINGRLTRAKRKMADYLKRNSFPESQL